MTITINSYNYSIITAHVNKEMYLKKYLDNYENKKIKLFVDMDGVIADYVYNEARSYDKKRPLYNNIRKLEEISKMSNIELFIFSATRYNEGTNEKHYWLDTYAKI